MNVLDSILVHKRDEVAAAKRARPIDRFIDSRSPRDFATALRSPGLSVIAEIKRRSPSKGPIRENLDVGISATSYRDAGAVAISCLTDARFFGSQPDDLPLAARSVGLPILRKEFIIDSYQIRESLHLGADAVLLIVRILSRSELTELLVVCRDLHLAALVEAHNESEIETAVAAGAAIIGINNRDLDTLQVTIDTALRMRKFIPESCIAVAESGIHRRQEMIALEQAGFDAVLLGEALLLADDPGAALRHLRGVEP